MKAWLRSSCDTPAQPAVSAGITSLVPPASTVAMAAAVAATVAALLLLPLLPPATPSVAGNVSAALDRSVVLRSQASMVPLTLPLRLLVVVVLLLESDGAWAGGAAAGGLRVSGTVSSIAAPRRKPGSAIHLSTVRHICMPWSMCVRVCTCAHARGMCVRGQCVRLWCVRACVCARAACVRGQCVRVRVCVFSVWVRGL